MLNDDSIIAGLVLGNHRLKNPIYLDYLLGTSMFLRIQKMNIFWLFVLRGKTSDGKHG